MYTVNSRIKKIIISQLEEDFKDSIIFYFEDNEFWITDIEKTYWFVFFNSDGSLFFNKKIFNYYLVLFSISQKQFSNFLKIWLEKTLKQRFNTVCKYNDIIYKLRKRSSINDDLTSMERLGYCFEFIELYLNFKKNNPEVLFKNFMVKNSINLDMV